MKSRWSAIALIVISGGYVVGYVFLLLMNLLLDNPSPNLDHTPAQGMAILFVFMVGILSTIIYLTFLFPEIRSTVHKSELGLNASPLEVIYHISSDEEIEVIKLVIDLAPRAYKFEIAKKSGLSRMKIHRIIVRLADRGIVNVEKNGRYSQVALAPWLEVQ